MTGITFRKCKTPAGDVEAVVERRWYGALGYFRLEVGGFGMDETRASDALQSMLVEASAGVSMEIEASLKRTRAVPAPPEPTSVEKGGLPKSWSAEP
jgi:hypothetical protein